MSNQGLRRTMVDKKQQLPTAKSKAATKVLGAYKVPKAAPESRSTCEKATVQKCRTTVQNHRVGVQFPESNNNGGGENIAAPGSIELFDDDNDRPFTLLQSNQSQPLSLFANHPRSGQVSGGHTPSGSVHHSRPPSVLMNVFNEPVRDLPRSRSVFRTDSTMGSRLHSQLESFGTDTSTD
ncbi:MAG: hypothetical protein J3Q66DRAFT_368790 [Benniella sp.]|nr:MAG: hypothetical protein J3Q66DRAFT_368790 [Benniella sp.]